MVARIPCTAAASSFWFFAENGSIDGGMIQACSAGIHGGTYCRREKTKPCTGARYGRRNSHAARVASFCQSTPM